ncbi:hypothetical protein CJU90_6615 [Yarrowia sp. C11]|nr:hypothetical protein CJU90_6615 [Yarrowia sp. C11]KAG5358726.1 hypothetical protein CKK34_4992 [Yarrowia sp. E02]
MGFLGTQQPSTRRHFKQKHPNVTRMPRRLPKTILPILGEPAAKRRKCNPVPLLDGLPLEILEQIFVESASPEFVLTNRTIFEKLNSTCMFLRARMVLNWVERKEPEKTAARETATAEPEQQAQGDEPMTQEQVDQDINNHIHHPQTFHIDDMVVDPQPQEAATNTTQEDQKDIYTIPVEQLKWKFVTSQLLETLDVQVSGSLIPSHYALADAPQRKKDLLPLLKKSGLRFHSLSRVLSNAARDPEHFKFLVKLDFGPPTIACLIAALRATDSEELLHSSADSDLLPNWLIRSGYYVDKLSSDELWSFLVAHPDRNLVRYFLQQGVVPSERLLHQIPAL